jgi:hypothetical protein
MERSGEWAQLLGILGFSPDSNPGEIAVEEARMQLCSKLGMPTTTPDDVLIQLAKQVGYRPSAETKYQSRPMAAAQPAAQPAAPIEPASGDEQPLTIPKQTLYADELAQIPRRTATGLSSLSNSKSSQTSLKPHHSWGAASSQSPAQPVVPPLSLTKPVVPPQFPTQPKQQQQPPQQPPEKRIQSMRSLPDEPLPEEEPSIWSKISQALKKLIGR